MVLPQKQDLGYGTVDRTSTIGNHKYTRVRGTEVFYVHSLFERGNETPEGLIAKNLGIKNYEQPTFVEDASYLDKGFFPTGSDSIDVEPVEGIIVRGELERLVDEHELGTVVVKSEPALPVAGRDYPNVRGYEPNGWRLFREEDRSFAVMHPILSCCGREISEHWETYVGTAIALGIGILSIIR